MASPVQNATVHRSTWRNPMTVFHAAPRAVLWTVVLALAWAILRPPVTLLAGMVRWQPAGSEHLYLMGVGVAIALDLALYGFLLVFLLRRERWSQNLLIGASLVQALYWGAQLARSTHAPVAVPPNFPDFANPPMIGRDAMYAISALIPLLTAVVAAWPSIWAWTKREEDPDAPDA